MNKNLASHEDLYSTMGLGHFKNNNRKSPLSTSGYSGIRNP